MGRLIKFAHVNEHGNFPAILAHYGLEYTRKGDQLRLLCPFHDDTKPSLNITLTATASAQANTFHCFGCHESGSLIDFVAAMEGTTDLRAAAEIVARVSGCDLAPPRTEKRAKKAKSAQTGKGPKSRSERFPSDNGGHAGKNAATATLGGNPATFAVNPPLKFAFTLDPAHPYLDSRVDPQTITEFGLGFLPETSRSMMKGRICIPIHDADSQLIAYAGRYPEPEPPGDVPKYLLPKAFEKQAALFNLHRVDPTSKWVVLVEGFFGAMRLHCLGVPAVALMGTAISPQQIALLEARQTKFVYLMLDGDDPGRAAADALLPLLSRSFLVKVIDLPDGMEPDTVNVETMPSGLVVRHRSADGTRMAETTVR